MEQPSTSTTNRIKKNCDQFSKCQCVICLNIEENQNKTFIADSIEKISKLDFSENIFIRLEKLVISLNSLKKIHQRSFQPLINLVVLFFLSPYILAIPKKLFLPLMNLRKLYLDILLVSKLSKNQFVSLKNLEMLIMNLSFVHIPPRIFYKLNRLQYLEINDYSRFSMLDATSMNNGHFIDLRNLKILVLVHVKIETIDLENLSICKSLRKLEELHITKSFFIIFNLIYIVEMKSLKILNLSFNQIRSIANYHFLQFFNMLTELDLSHNCLTQIDIIMTGDNRLQKINLSHNFLNSCNSINFCNLHNLEELYLDGCNDFPELSVHICKKFLTNEKVMIYVPVTTNTSEFKNWKQLNNIDFIQVFKDQKNSTTNDKKYVNIELMSSEDDLSENFIDICMRSHIFAMNEIEDSKTIISKLMALFALCYPEIIRNFEELEYYEIYKNKIKDEHFHKLIVLLKKKITIDDLLLFKKNIEFIKKLFE